MTPLDKNGLAARVAEDIPDGAYVNLGIGMPALISNYLPAGREVIYHCENGVLGIGPAPAPGAEDPDLINASKQPVTLLPGGAYFSHSEAFVMIRGGFIDHAVLGAFQVSASGDLANWSVGDDSVLSPAVGGAMDLAAGAKNVWVMMFHNTRDGAPKVMRQCGYPLTAKGVVKRIYTDLCVIDVTGAGLVVTEMAPGLDFETLLSRTQAPLVLAADFGENRGS